MNKIKKIKRLLFNIDLKATMKYAKAYQKNKVDENIILFQSFDGSSVTGNVYYILKELYNDNYYDKYN